MSGIIESSDRIDVNESAYVTGTITVGTTLVEAKVGAERLAKRQYISIHNYGPNTIYIGPEGTTVSTGRPVFIDQSMDIPVGNLAVCLIAEEENNIVVVQELG
jgi:hypothetical protein